MTQEDATPSSAVVEQLLSEQAPDLVDRVAPSDSSGSSNWVFRLGNDLAVRLPRSDDYAVDLAKEVRWLPHLGLQLPVAVPEIVFEGQPSTLFPRPWAVVTWVPGTLPGAQDDSEQVALARTLGGFLRSLHAVDTDGMRGGADKWGYRCGEPVTPQIDEWAEIAAAELADLFDPVRIRQAWRRLRDVPPASGPACWVHTDLSSENILVAPSGELVGVIDFGGLGVGDPSIDLLYAWSLYDAPARDVFRVESGADEATWLRARAWAFVGPGLLTLADYRTSMPTRTRKLMAMVESVAAEVGVSLR